MVYFWATGWILIDRDGEQFGNILKFLRDGKVCLPESVKEINDLLAEAEYYLIQELIDLCESKLGRFENRDANALVTEINDDISAIVERSTVPIVRLSIFEPRVYQSSSDETINNYNSNSSLFDKLCIRSNGRIKFIKSVSRASGLCKWTFYSRSIKVRDIDCTFIRPAIPVSYRNV